MADNEDSADSVCDIPTSTQKRKRKPKLTEEEKAEKSKRLTEEREQRKNESKRAKRRNPTSVSGTRTYGSGISDGPRKPYSRKPVPDDASTTLSSTLSSTLESQKEDSAVLSTPHSELPSEESEPFPTLATPSEPTLVEPSTFDSELHRDSTPVDKAPCAGNQNKDPGEAWRQKENIILESLINSYTIDKFICHGCGSKCVNGVIKCTNCCKYYCPECDRESHCYDPSHHRSFFRADFTSKILLPTEFINHQGIIKQQSNNSQFLIFAFISK